MEPVHRYRNELLLKQTAQLVETLRKEGPQTATMLADVIDWRGREVLLRQYLPSLDKPKTIRLFNEAVEVVCVGRFPVRGKSGPGELVYAISGDARPIPKHLAHERSTTLIQVLEDGPATVRDLQAALKCSLPSVYTQLRRHFQEAEVVFELPVPRGAPTQLWALSKHIDRDRERLLARKELIHRVLKGRGNAGMLLEEVHAEVPIEQETHVEGLLLLLKRERRVVLTKFPDGSQRWFAT